MGSASNAAGIAGSSLMTFGAGGYADGSMNQLFFGLTLARRNARGAPVCAIGPRGDELYSMCAAARTSALVAGLNDERLFAVVVRDDCVQGCP